MRTRNYVLGFAIAVGVGGCVADEPITAEGSQAIVNGWSATAAEAASIAYVQSVSDAGGTVGCTGTLIDRNWVMTAVHCVTGGKPQNTQVWIGSASEYHTITAIRTAPGDPVYYNDVALLHLDRPSQQPVIPIADSADRESWQVEPGQYLYAIATGWGNVDANGTGAATLQRTTVKIDYVSPNSDGNANKFIKTSQGIGYVCQGDSGSPLLITRADGTQAIAGVLSAADCAGYGKYTRVGEGTDWTWIRAQLHTPGGTIDFDGDGVTDAFTASPRAGGGFQWYFAPGAGSTWQALEYDEALPSALRFGDFDGDGVTDVFTAKPAGGGFQWMFSSGGRTGWIYLAWDPTPLSELRLGDFNGDGITDVFSSRVASGGYRWMYSPSGRLNWVDLAVDPTPLFDLRLGDFDGDGVTDVLSAVDIGSGVYQWRYSSGAMTSWQPLAQSYEPVSNLRFGDFDADGHTDVFAAVYVGNGVYQWRYSSAGKTAWRTLASSTESSASLRIGDFTGDARADVFRVRQSGSYIYLHEVSEGGRSSWSSIGLSYEPLSELWVGDLYDQRW